MLNKASQYLSKREQQIMEILYRLGSADVASVIAGLPDASSNPAIRTHLRILEDKGHVNHIQEGGRFVYRPTKSRRAAARAALAELLRTFFDDSIEEVMTTLLSVKSADLSPSELDRLRTRIDEARAGCQPITEDETPDA